MAKYLKSTNCCT